VTTPGPGGWVGVTAAGSQTCGIRTGGTLWCWGGNFAGELGIGNVTSQDRPQQVMDPAPEGWASVASRGYETCATRTGGTLWCWGYNRYGELGIGSHTDQDRPRQVTTPAPGGWASVAVGDFQACATRTGGALWCWGYNGHGQLGIGNHADQDLPQQVTIPAPGGWANVTSGAVQTCATRTGGTLWCWGANFHGQLGIGNETDQDRPRQVTGCAQPGIQARRARTPASARTTATGQPMQ
jgi:alpha-tubulin suppressor-like RCC1 family protein